MEQKFSCSLITVGVFLLVAFGLFGCGGGPEEDPVLTASEIVKRYKSSTVFILTKGSRGSGSGTGIVLDNEGHILTNNHVISGTSYQVRNPETDDLIPAQIVGRAPCDDLAVVRVREDIEDFKPASFGNAKDMETGAEVFAVGFPGTVDQDFSDTELSITKGIISRLDARYDPRGLRDLMQIDAALNPGNSGGPLINNRGRVIGINTLGTSADLENQNYAITINNAKNIYQELLKEKDLDWIGVNVKNITVGDNNTPFLMVTNVDSGSDFDEDNWVPGYIIDKVEGQVIDHLGDLCEILRSQRSGDQLKVQGIRFDNDGNLIKFTSNITKP